MRRTNAAQTQVSWIELRETVRNTPEPLRIFALVNLGIAQSLVSGVVTAEDAVSAFYNADNCLFVRREMRNKTADAIMSRDAQLADLFAVLPESEARRAFYAEIETIRSSCLRLLGKSRSAGHGTPVAA